MDFTVAPFTGAWIEIPDARLQRSEYLGVAPFTGAWIEIYNQLLIKKHLIHVAPFTGAWIEINVAIVRISCMFESHPSRVRGLKWFPIFRVFGPFDVAPFTGAWIEIDSSLSRRRCC